MASAIGIPVIVHDACRGCGGNACFISTGSAPTYRQLLCDACEISRGLASKELITFLEKFVEQFGWPDQPIILRTGKVHKPGSVGDDAATATEPKTKRKGKPKMKMSDLFPSKYLRAADLSKPRVVTIEKVEHEIFKDDGADVLKSVLHFKEKDCRPTVINKTNFGTLVSITGEDDDELWVGHKIELRSQKVMGPGGKVVDSIRVHEAPKPKKSLKEELNDEVGF
jgi:hypothetical protein